MEKMLYLLLVLLVIGAIWLEAWYFADFRRKIGQTVGSVPAFHTFLNLITIL